MKKFLIISTLSLLSFVIIDAQAQKKPPVMDSTIVTYSKVYNDAKTAIAAIASSLQVGAEHVYEVLVRQQIVKSVTFLIIDVIWLVLIAFMFKKLFVFQDKFEEDQKEPDYSHWDTTLNEVLRNGFAIGCVLSMLFGTIVILATVDNIITGFINPEYGALKDIMEMINPPKEN